MIGSEVCWRLQVAFGNIQNKPGCQEIDPLKVFLNSG